MVCWHDTHDVAFCSCAESPQVNVSGACREKILETDVTAFDIFEEARAEVLVVMEVMDKHHTARGNIEPLLRQKIVLACLLQRFMFSMFRSSFHFVILCGRRCVCVNPQASSWRRRLDDGIDSCMTSVLMQFVWGTYNQQRLLIACGYPRPFTHGLAANLCHAHAA